MKIVRVAATPLNVPLHIKLLNVDRKSSLSSCYVEVETDTGQKGYGELCTLGSAYLAAYPRGGRAGQASAYDDRLHLRPPASRSPARRAMDRAIHRGRGNARPDLRRI